MTRQYSTRDTHPGQGLQGRIDQGRKRRQSPGKTPGSRATAAAIRSLTHSPEGPQLTFSESIDYLYARGARFVLLCDRCDYGRPRCQRCYPDLPAGSLKWGSWQPTPNDVPADTTFAPGGPSSDPWGVPVRHLPVGIEPAILAMAALNVDLYDLPILAVLVKTAAPAAVTISRGGGPLPPVPCRPHAIDLPPMVVPSVMLHRQASVLRGTATTSRLYSASRATASNRSEFTEGGTGW